MAETTTRETLDNGQQVLVRWDPVDGVPAFLTGPVSVPQADNLEASTYAFLDQNAELFRMDDPWGELRLERSDIDGLGMTHLHMAQIYRGVPVFGAELAVHYSAEGMLTAINGDYKPGLDLSVEPVVSREQAMAVATAAMPGGAVAVAPEPPELVVLASAGMDAALVWKVPLASDYPPASMVFFVDAREGGIISSYDNLQDVRNRSTYTAGNGTSIPGTLVLSEGSPWSGDAVVNAAHYNAGLTYDYYYGTFGRDSLDGSGMALKSTVHYSSGYNNAFWNGYQMTYGDGDGYVFSPLGNSLDVVAHEMTHGVTQYTAGLVYSYQSGALNESYSDVFGVMVDRDDWLLGEDVYTPQTPGDALRSLADPPRFGQPAHMNDYVDTSSDNGGVHINSGITNKAAYNVATTIGNEKMEQVWYRTLTNYLTPGSQFTDARDASVQAAADLYGAGSAEVAAVSSGFSAVGIGDGGAPSETTARIEIDHSYRGDLVVTVGVGNPDSPVWSTVVSNRQGGSADNIYITVDISGGAASLPPSWADRWYVSVYDAAGYDTGQISTFSITDHGTTFTATDVPVQIDDYQTAYSYIPTDDSVSPSVTGTDPASSETTVYADSSIRATFSEDIAAATLNPESFTLVQYPGGTPVDAQVSYDGASRTAILDPTSDLSYSTEYVAKLTTDITDLAGNSLEQAYQWSFTTAPPPKYYYFTWYDMMSPDMSDWLMMGNPAENADEAGFNVYVSDIKASAAPIEVQPGDTESATYQGTMGGPVKMASLTGESEVISKRTLYGNSFEEITGIEESRLDSHYFFTWYDTVSPGARDWILIANPGSSAVEADIYIGGQRMNDTAYLIEAGGTVTPEFPGILAGPVEVIAHEPGDPSVPRDVIATQRVLWKGDFNEVMGIPAAELTTSYTFSWYDQASPGARDWVLVANPHADRQLAAEIWIAGERMTDSATGEQYFLVAPGESVTPSFDGVMDGPVVVRGYDAASYDPDDPGVPDLDFYTTQRCLFGDSFEEVTGYGNDRLAAVNHFSWYDQATPGALDWVLISNPGVDDVKAEVWIGGQRMTDNASGEQYFLVPAGKSVTPSFPGSMDGPVEVRGYDASGYDAADPGIPDSPIFTSQRVLWNGHFSEVCGIVLN